MNRKIIAVMGLSGLLTFGCTTETNEERFEKAKSDFDSGAYDVTAINLKDIIREEPTFLEARMLLLETYLKTSQIFNAKREATRILENASQLSLEDSKAMVEKYLLLSFLNQEFSDIENFEDTFPSMQSAYTKKLLHRLSLFIDDSPVHKRAESGPQDPLTLALHELYLSVATGANADTEALTFIKQESSGFYLPLLGQYFLKKNDFSECIKNFSEFEDKNFHHPFISLRLAQCYFDEKQYSESFEYAQQILTDYPEQPLANKIVGTIFFLKGAMSKAEPYLVKASSANQSDFATKTYLGTIYLQQGYYEKAYQQLKGVETAYPQSHPARKVLAITQMKLGQYEQKLDEFVSKKTIKDDSDIAFLAIAASTALENGDKESQAKLVAEIAGSEVSSPEMEVEKLRLINQLYSPANNLDFNFVPKIAPDNSTLSRVIIGTLFRYTQTEKLYEVSKNWRAKSPANADFAEGAALYLDEKYTQAVGFFTKAKDNTNLLLNSLLVDAYVKSDQLNKAIALLKSLINESANPGLLLDQLYSLNLANSLPQDFVHRKVKELASVSANYYLLKAKFSLLDQDFASANQSLEKYRVEVEEVSNTYWKLNLKSKILTGKPDDVIEAFDKWIKAYPTNAEPTIAKVSYLETLGRLDEAHILTQRSMTKFKDERFKLFDVNFLVMNGEYENAAAKFATLSAAQKETPLGKGIRASFAFNKKDYLAAERIVREAYETTPSSRSASMIFSALMHQNKKEQAISFLEKHISYLPSDQINMRLLADTLISSDLKKAQSYYIFMLKVSPQDHQIMNNLAWIESQLGNKENAKTLIEKALELKPDNKDYQDTLKDIINS